MWLKKLITKRVSTQSDKNDKTPKPDITEKPDKIPTNEIQQNRKAFKQDDEQLMTSAAVIDIQPDTRYKQFLSISKNYRLQIPSRAFHDTQQILFHSANTFNAKINQNYIDNQVTIILTDRQLLITPNIFQGIATNAFQYNNISYGSIQKCEIIANKKKIPERLKITLQDNRQLLLTSQTPPSLTKICQILNTFAFVRGVNKFYAFRFGSLNKIKQNLWQGWKLYDIKKQFQRQGLIIHHQKLSHLKFIHNQNGQFCYTYPQLLVIPAKINQELLRKCSQFRSKQRFPALTYYYQYKDNQYSTLFRCSQNRVGVRNARSKQDQLMIQYIGELNSSPILLQDNKKKKNCKIYDARGYYSALGNRFVGKGYQNTQFYTNCQITWLNIPNIHAVRQSYQLMMNYREQNSNFLSTCVQSKWYEYLSLIIQGSKQIVKDILSGIHVIVHCSDGWDRTSQLCALSQIILDPFYRTIQGLAILIQKDWRHFGHKFRQRTGQFNAIESFPYEKSPIFIQFLDSIYQIMEQFPLSFQYNQLLLLFLAKNVDSNVYGTFMSNNIQQCKQLKIQQNTISIWSHILENRAIYLNPYYNTNIRQSFLDVGIEVKYMTIWRSLFLGDNTKINIVYQIMKSQSSAKQSLQDKRIANLQLIQNLKQQLQDINSQI